jgi:hypothetical protein
MPSSSVRPIDMVRDRRITTGQTFYGPKTLFNDNLHLDSIIVNHIQTVSGGFFNNSHDFAAEVTEIRGGEDASGMAWQWIRYRIVHRDESRSSTVTVELGDRVPFAPQTPSLWVRLSAYH